MSTSTAPFLTAGWRNLIMANYVVDPAVLKPFLPGYTELDYFDNNCYVSLVGFLFDNVKIKGISIPFHTRFPEVNLRFYVKYRHQQEWKRGVVFISEIVPKPMIAWVANTLYKERYSAVSMKHHTKLKNGQWMVQYQWKSKGQWFQIQVEADNNPRVMKPESKEAFIFEHYWGYSRVNDFVTNEYQVLHPSWQVYPVTNYRVDCDFALQYGAVFAGLNNSSPDSVFLAEGSAISVTGKRTIKGNC
jgi:uncharacterized protein